ncbi:glycosyltransferase family 2 protein [Flavobacterium sp. Arc2]|uniref:glycosyltransferase family 2 protein n=1 Tax=Flavobacterium sp. Arc2 TaxID=3046685 RepID=UPI00352F06C3
MSVQQNIAVLLTCHNRKLKTLGCLTSFYTSNLPQDFILDVFLVDDGSTDGTAEAIKINFPSVKIVYGDGNLYWNRGMHLAWQTAVATKDYDYYLWLNDDTILFENAINIMLNSSQTKKNEAIICGCTQSLENKKITYGGRKDGVMIEPNGSLQKCDLINGNFLLIPKAVYELNGILDPLFHHALGDHEYGLRAQKKGIDSFISPVYIGYCEQNLGANKSFRVDVPIIDRLKHLYSPLGVNPIVYFKYDYRYFGLLNAVKHFFSIHLHSLIPTLWEKK